MLISLNWLSDFVELPADLDARAAAERFTTTCAEVEDVFSIHAGERTPAETVTALDDWIIEIDNKSITHRPDLWGHYGIAREMAAMLGLPLRPLELADGDRLDSVSLPEIPISIDDPRVCPRYSGLLIAGVTPKPSPRRMQDRLSHVGFRPINALVDLTNYVMAEMGQPMHAFDADKVDRIEVAVSEGGETFITLDGMPRTLPAGTIMIQSGRRNVALAGIMGGLDTEVTAATARVLLESANFDAASIRRAAAAMGHRTDASMRFEKSLDPANTVLAIARFVHLAEPLFPKLKLGSRLSDCFPQPPPPRHVAINPSFVSMFIGKNIALSEMKRILETIEFQLEDQDDHIEVVVPSYRATKDIEVEADVIEEIARFVGYGNIEPIMPRATVRHFEPNALHGVEKRTLQLLCLSEGYHEINDYVWYHEDWLARLGYDPGDSQTLKNAPAHGLHRLRKSLVPGLLQAADLNRRALPDLRLLLIGSVFEPPQAEAIAGEPPAVDVLQQRHAGLLSMLRRKKAEQELLEDLRASLAKWARELFDRTPRFLPARPLNLPWESDPQTAEMRLDDVIVGRLAAVPLELRRRIDEHFTAWSVAIAELNLSAVCGLSGVTRPLPPVPAHPQVHLDFSVLADAERAYEGLADELRTFKHALLKRLTFEGSYEGPSVPAGRRSLLLRARIADDHRTLNDEDIKGFSQVFEAFLGHHDLEIRR